jgi:DtxR family Mn-dependent transcriptional regulator
MVKDSSPSGVSASLEDYLEAIFWLAQENHVARSRDIAERLAVSKSSVTGALKQLTAEGFINYDPYSYVTLTEEGRQIAQNVIRRHSVLNTFLHRVLGLNEADADHFACLIEHSIDDHVRERFEQFMEFVDSENPDMTQWLEEARKQWRP